MLLTLLLMPAALVGIDVEKFMDIRPGTIPIIVSAPHGGRQEIPGVPLRVGGNTVKKFVTVLDTNTLELAEALIPAIENEFGGKPYIVFARFTRKQIDANRPAEDSYENSHAKPYYDAYHKALLEACRDIRKTWGGGLLLDLHAQAKTSDLIYRGTQNLKTVKLLKDRFGMAAITGPNSLLGQMSGKGYGIFPPIADPADAAEFPSYSGGWIVGRYGADSGTGLDAIQLEIGARFRTNKTIPKTAADLAAGLKVFSTAYLPQERRK